MAGYVRLDKVHAIANGTIESVKHTADTTLKVENGFVGVAGKLAPNEREIRVLEKPKSVADKLVVISNDEINYEEVRSTDRALEAFTGISGDEGASRAYRLEAGDMVSFSKDCFEGTPAKDKLVVAKADSFKLEVLAGELTADTEYGFVGVIEGIEQFGTTIAVGQAGNIARPTELVVVTVLQN